MAEPERRVKWFRDGRSQVLLIPHEYEFDADEAILRKAGARLIIEPIRKGQLMTLLAGMAPLEVAFPDVDIDLPDLD